MKKAALRLLAVGLVVLTPLLLLTTTAGATQENENQQTTWPTYPGQSECEFVNEYGEYIEAAYSSALIEYNQCLYVQTQVVYASGGNLYGGSWIGGFAENNWYQSIVNYQSVFGANVMVTFNTINYGSQRWEWNFTPFG